MCAYAANATGPAMTIARAALLFPLAALALSACDKEPTPEAGSREEVTEATTMADDAVTLAEQALDNAAMSDESAASASPSTRVTSTPANAPPESAKSEAETNRITAE